MTNSSFRDGVQYAWDSTSISAAMTCPRKYYYQMIRNLRPMAKSVHLLFGGHYATALEHFYKHRALGDDIDTALLKVVREAMLDTWDYEANAPVPFLDSKKTRANLIRSIVWYVDAFGDEESSGIKTHHLSDGKPAVELSFTLPLEEEFVLCGHLDRVVDYGGSLYIMDQKAQPLTSRVLTPFGWTTIGQLSIGDLIATKSGEFVSVSALHPKGVTKAYRVFFNDGSFVECAEDHLWNVATQSESTFTTRPMTELLHKKPYVKYHVPLCEPIQHPEATLPLHPYLLGVLLGDGFLNGNSIQLSTTKEWLIEEVRRLLPEGERMKKASQFNNSWTISGGATLAAIRQLGLYGSLAYTKFVPPIYLFASVEQRRALLQGLLDTDGSWNGKSRIFDSTSPKLVEAVVALVRSLGGTARYRDRHDTAYRVSLRLPDLPTGVGRRYISAIERITDTETMCISVDHPSGLYITDNYTVTHNTTGGTISSYFFDGFKPDVQMSLYSFAGQIILKSPVAGVIIDGAQIAVSFTRFERGFTYRSQDELEEFFENTKHLIQLMQSYTMLGAFPMNTTACGNYGGCPFKPICSAPPRLRESVIKSSYREETWDPIKRR